MPWPMSQDYNEAIQEPALCFSDADLKAGEVVCNALGLPVPCSGNFADVYAVTAGARKFAVKCFTRQIPGIRERYVEISKFLAANPLPFMVEFKFLEQGIKIGAQWYPILKMQWVEGFNLNAFTRDNVDKPQVLQTLSIIWQKLALRLKETGLAHCDLQHGNVLLVPGAKAGMLSVRLVDYDGMFVPSLEMLKTIEVGHANFQHPQRQKEGIYSIDVDRFSHLVIFTALRALAVGGKALWQKYDNGDNLLFKAADFQAPTTAPVFQDLLRINDPDVKKLTQALLTACQKPLDQTPHLHELVAPPPQTTSIAAQPAARQLAAAAPAAPNAFASIDEGPARRRTTARTPKPAGKGNLGILLGAGVAVSLVLIIGVVGLLLALRPKPTEMAVAPPTPASFTPATTPTAATTRVQPPPPTQPEVVPPVVPVVPPPVDAAGKTFAVLPLQPVVLTPGTETLVEVPYERGGLPGNIAVHMQGVPPGVTPGQPIVQPNKLLIRLTTAPGAPDATRRLIVQLTIAGQTAQAETTLTLKRGEAMAAQPAAAVAREIRQFPGGGGAMQRLAVSPDGKLVAAAGNDRAAHLWDIESGQLLRSFRGHTGTLLHVHFSPDGKRLATAGGESAIRVWDVATGQAQVQMAGRNASNWLVFSPDGRRVLAGCRDNTAKLFDAQTGQLVQTYTGHTGVVNGVGFGPAGKTMVTASWDGSVREWDTASGKELRKLGEHPGRAMTAAAAPDGRLALSGGADGVVNVYDLTAGRLLHAMKGHVGEIWAVAVSADGNRGISSGSDNTVRTWDLKTGQALATATGHNQGVSGAAFTAGADRAVSCALDGTVRLWDFAGGAGPVVTVPPPPVQPLAAGVNYLDNLPEVASNVGWGKLGKKGDLGFVPDNPPRPSTILVNGRRYAEAVALHPPAQGFSWVKYRLDKTAQTFISGVAINDSAESNLRRTPLTFVVLGDDRELWKSEPALDLKVIQQCKVSVAGVSVLELRVYCPGHLVLAHAVWLDPHVVSDGKPADPAPPTVARRAAVPDAAKQAEAEKLIKEIYKADYARKTQKDQLTLGATLYQRGQETKDDAVARYVLLREARDLLAAGGDVSYAFKVLDLLTKEYVVNELEAKAAVLEAAARAPSTSESLKTLMTSALGTVDGAVEEEKFDVAVRLVKVAESAALRTKQAAPLITVRARAKEVDAAQKESEKAKEALAALEKNPDDPAVNLAAGKYLCCIKGDWNKGLPLLAKSSNPKLKELAAKDLATAGDAEQRMATGDAWWDQAEVEKAYQKQLRLRAAHWYQTARIDLTGLAKETVEKRLASVGPLVAQPQVINLLSVIDPLRDAVKGRWAFQANKALIVPAVGAAMGDIAHLQIPQALPAEYVLEMTVTRISGNDSLNIGLVSAGRQFQVVLDGWSAQTAGIGQTAGIDLLDGKASNANETTVIGRLFAPNTPVTVRCQVEKQKLTIMCNDKTVIRWQGDPTRLSMRPDWPVTQRDQLFLGSVTNTSYAISRLVLRPLK